MDDPNSNVVPNKLAGADYPRSKTLKIGTHNAAAVWATKLKNMGEQVKVSAPLSSEKVERDCELEQRYFELLELRHRVRIAECGRVIKADPYTAEGPAEW